MLNLSKHIDFVGKQKIAAVLSILLIVAAVTSLATRGLSLGIDFTGGTLVELAYPETVDLDQIRDQLETGGFGDAITQYFGSSKDVLVRLEPRDGISNSELSTHLLDVLNAGAEISPVLRRVEFVGPQVGSELAEKGALAMLYALIGILIYVSWRFEFRLAIGAVAALVHDVLITLGIFSIAQIEFNLTVVAAILAVIGYSLNDTIVVSDRIRENFRKIRKGAADEIVNISLNETLSRTLVTSLTTLLVLLALFFLGGKIIHGFSTALIIGVLVGTYSSIYVASTVALSMGVSKEHFMLPEKEDLSEFQKDEP